MTEACCQTGAVPLDIQGLRKHIRDQQDCLRAAYPANEQVLQRTRERARCMDRILVALWRHHFPQPIDMALIAVGGYGRMELHPASDIDLLILVSAQAVAAHQERLERLLTTLWDIRLDIGHSVRSLDECLQEAARDLTVITNLTESRLLCGDAELFEQLQDAIRPQHIWPSKRFFEAKLQEQRQRHQRYDAESNLEPNIKESPGGLRDIQTIGWVAKRHFGASEYDDLVEMGFLGRDECQRLKHCKAHLAQIRDALHELTGRHEDRLLFDYQRTLASQFGFTDAQDNLGVEQFMQGYYRTAQEVARLNELLLQVFTEEILYPGGASRRYITRRFQLNNGYLETTHDKVFLQYPIALLEVFHLMQMYPDIRGIRASCLRLLQQNLDRIDASFRDDIKAQSLFMEILRTPTGLPHVLRLMNRYGVLARYLPPFGNIVGRMQYDLYHVYTVDIHTLTLVQNLRQMQLPEFIQQHPVRHALIRNVPKVELLFIAALFHDIAKGRGGDHSKLGAQDARAFCRTHHLSEHDADLVAWLVDNHLKLSMTAQRHDLSDPQEIQQFAIQVGDINRLNHLYLLTVADSQATNPKRWTSWRDALLTDWYQHTRNLLLRGLDNPIMQDEFIQEKQQQARQTLQERGFQKDQIIALWINFHLDFFLYNTLDDIVWYSEYLLKHPRTKLPLIKLRTLANREATEIFVYSARQRCLFTKITATLDQLGLNIQDAWSMNTDQGKVLSTFVVLLDNGLPVKNQQARQEIKAQLQASLNKPDKPIPVTRRQPRIHRHFDIPTHISIYPDRKNHRTVIQLTTGDRPGLLADVGHFFAENDIIVHKARISTIGAKVEDMFFVADAGNCPITDPQHIAAIRDALRQSLG